MTEQDKKVWALLDAVTAGNQDARRELEKMEKQNPDEMRHIYTRIRLSTPIALETVGHKELTPEDIRKTDEIARELGWFGDDWQEINAKTQPRESR